MQVFESQAELLGTCGYEVQLVRSIGLLLAAAENQRANDRFLAGHRNNDYLPQLLALEYGQNHLTELRGSKNGRPRLFGNALNLIGQRDGSAITQEFRREADVLKDGQASAVNQAKPC